MSILLSKVIVSASSAAVALAFDAGGSARQEDIWVADLTGGKGVFGTAWAREQF